MKTSRYNNQILYLRVKKLRMSSHSKLVLIKNRNGASISDKERVKERWTENLWNVINRDKYTGNVLEKNERS